MSTPAAIPASRSSGVPDAHEVPGLLPGKLRSVAGHAVPHLRRLLPHRISPQGVSGQVERGGVLDGPAAQVREEAALGDAEQRGPLPVGRFGGEPRVPAAEEPALRPRQRLLVVGALGLCRGALVEGHDHVCAQVQLDADGGLRGEEVARTVEVAAEGDPLLGDPHERVAAVLPGALEAVDLEAARVGEHGPAPGDEAVETAQAPDPLVPGTEVQVVGVAEDDPRAQLDEIARREGLHGSRRAHRHEDGGIEGPARRLETPAAGCAVLGQELEADQGGTWG